MWWLAAILTGFGLGAVLGAPYLPILRRDREALLDLAGLQAGQTLLDLGSGDGQLLRAAARRGARAIGYEVNPILFAFSWVWCWPYRQLITVRLADFWRERWPKADVVSVFLIERYMAKLSAKLEAELKAPTRVVSYVFAIPGKDPRQTTKNSFLYHYPN